MQRIKTRAKKRKVVKQQIPTEKQNNGQEKSKDLSAPWQNQNTDINISIDT